MLESHWKLSNQVSLNNNWGKYLLTNVKARSYFDISPMQYDMSNNEFRFFRASRSCLGFFHFMDFFCACSCTRPSFHAFSYIYLVLGRYESRFRTALDLQYNNNERLARRTQNYVYSIKLACTLHNVCPFAPNINVKTFTQYIYDSPCI